MARSIWKGSISFGLVQIPVGLYPAESSSELAFHMLDKRNMARVRYERVNEATGEPVPWDQIVKGYEYAPGDWVIVEPEDFTKANVEATQTVDIVQFVRAEELGPLYFDRPYYLAPAGRGQKAYALLREVMRRSGRVAIAKVVIRTRQHLAALLVEGRALVLELLRWPQDLRAPSELDLPAEEAGAAGVSTRELDMAERLVDGLSEPFDPTRYHDDYTDDLLALIEEKHATGEATPQHGEDAARADARRAEVVDIVELLKKSLDRTGEARGAEAEEAEPEARPATKKAGARDRSRTKTASRTREASPRESKAAAPRKKRAAGSRR